MIQWNLQLGPVACGLLLLAMPVCVLLAARRLRGGRSRARVAAVLVPRVLVFALLAVALLDPSCSRTTVPEEGPQAVVALVDASSSMDVADDGHAARVRRATAFLRRLQNRLPHARIDAIPFDTSLHPSLSLDALDAAPPPATNAGLRGTDLAACLLQLPARHDLSLADAVLLLTDGGDEAPPDLEPPGPPFAVVRVATPAETWTDVAIRSVDAPPRIEKDAEFELRVHLTASAGDDPGFRRRLRRVVVSLREEPPDGPWTATREKIADLSNGRALLSFHLQRKSHGPVRYVVEARPLPGELSALNNTRVAHVTVSERSCDVLFFSRELGAGFKLLRAELARDPGIAFTAMFRTSGEHFTIQGRRHPGDRLLEAGLPDDCALLQPFDCVILGSFPAGDISTAQQEALARYVENGGALVCLGGEDSFGRGGYAASPLAPLLPWQLSPAEPPLSSGVFPVRLPPAAASHPVMAGLASEFALLEPSLKSLNHPGPLKPGAVSLLQADMPGASLAVIAFHRYGKGRILAIASNTLWEWATLSDGLRALYGRFWRQAVRALADYSDEAHLLAVRWDRDRYLPGQEAVADIRLLFPVSDDPIRLSATISTSGESEPVPVEPVAGAPGAWRARFRFRHRGQATFRLVLLRRDAQADSYAATFQVAPLAEEGSSLEADSAIFEALARSAHATLWSETEDAALADALRTSPSPAHRTSAVSLTQSSPWFAIALIILLTLEWTIRRRSSLL